MRTIFPGRKRARGCADTKDLAPLLADDHPAGQRQDRRFAGPKTRGDVLQFRLVADRVDTHDFTRGCHDIIVDLCFEDIGCPLGIDHSDRLHPPIAVEHEPARKNLKAAGLRGLPPAKRSDCQQRNKNCAASLAGAAASGDLFRPPGEGPARPSLAGPTDQL